MAEAVLDTMTQVIGELQTWSFSTILTIPDAVGGQRPPTLGEITAMELSVFLVDGGVYSYITAWVYLGGTWSVGTELLKNINIMNTGRGIYDQATGLLTVMMHAGDNPCVAVGTAPGMKEIHRALVTVRYNANIDQLPKTVKFQVENLNKVPREP